MSPQDKSAPEQREWRRSNGNGRNSSPDTPRPPPQNRDYPRTVTEARKESAQVTKATEVTHSDDLTEHLPQTATSPCLPPPLSPHTKIDKTTTETGTITARLSTLLRWNIHSLVSKSASLLQYIHIHDAAVILLRPT